MTKVCPINHRQVNERVARINALFTLVITTYFLITNNVFLLLILFIDFFIRGYLQGSYSLFSFLSKKIVRVFNWEIKLIDAGPKEFAAKIGTIMTGKILVFQVIGFSNIYNSVGAILVFFSGLEFVFGLCVACKLYPYYNSFIQFSKPLIKTSK